MRTALVVGLVVVLFCVAAVSGVRLERLADDRPVDRELLYLPNARHLELASLGQQALLADLIYLWAIQFYSNYARENRFKYVEHIFGNVIARLDPQYIDAYWIGAMIMSVEARDLEAALRLLDRGRQENPDNWILPWLAGWECYLAGDPKRAKVYFQAAEAAPGSPPKVRRVVAGLTGRTGDLREAAALWAAILEDPASDEFSQAVAQAQLRGLTTRIDLQNLQRAIDAFRVDNGRLPESLDELTVGSENGGRSYLTALPQDSSGRPYHYDPVSGEVSSSADRVLEAS